ncbi:CPBP family glutamic-type intramembrane protease [Lacrimispora sp. 38-1]|uniref:CPBP family glutamic-type intramembrane protease n=1 Tax=Lacrimispora sp. 38-1 TaxID=3125778 RepID=UPI003CF29BD5
MEKIKKLPLWKSILFFALPSTYFFIMTRFFTPFLNQSLKLHPSLSWYVTGIFVFVPLFIMANLLVKHENGRLDFKTLLQRLRFKKLTWEDIKWTLGATLLSFIAMGIIWGISNFLTFHFSVSALQTTPGFMSSQPLEGMERLYLLVWMLMFFFNIVGEQMLWHGYILPRQELTHGKWAWFVNACCWLLFHLCFGIDLIILLLPLLFIIPFTIQRTKNTTTGLIVHAIVNGPMAVLIALGFIK